MKLIYRITLRLSFVLIPLLALWGILFFYNMVDEINDEADDALERFSEQIIRKKLAGQDLSGVADGSNNSYSIVPILGEYANMHPHIEYYDTEISILGKNEIEPARVLRTIFTDDSGQYYDLKVMTPTFEKEDLFATIFNQMIVLYLVVMLTIIVVVMVTLNRNMRPFYVLLRWLDSYTPGSNRVIVPNDTTIPEFKKMGIALQEAVDRSEDLYEQQKQFIGNASHELQTPLAVIGNRIDWMVDSMDLSEEPLNELFLIRKELRHIIKLNKTLLLLTKIDSQQFPEVEDVDVVALINEQVEMLSEIYSYKGICCELVLPKSFVYKMNVTLANVLIGNIMKNAFVHSSNGSRIEVTLKQNVLIVSNSGESSLDADRIFDRFYQGTKKEESSGLGLALVYAVAHCYNLKLSYSFEAKQHSFQVIW